MKLLLPALALCAIAPAQQSVAGFIPVTDKMLANPDPADWLMWRRTLNSWGYSPLNQINRKNVSTLRMVWTRGMAPGLQEAVPLVYRGVMYLPNPRDVIQAMDAATGELIWEYRRQWPNDIAKFFPVPDINRNLAIYENKIIDTSADDFVFAPRCYNRQTGLGKPDRRLPGAFGPADLRPDHGYRKDLFGSRL